MHKNSKKSSRGRYTKDYKINGINRKKHEWNKISNSTRIDLKQKMKP